MKQLLNTSAIPILLCRIAVGFIFLSEGIQKYIRPEDVGSGRFMKLGFPHPAFWAYFTGSFEIICGLLILAGLLTRLAAAPLLIVMITAFMITKLPILQKKGFWPFAHEYRTDFAVTLLLVLLLTYGAGDHSFDLKITKNK